MSIPGSPMREYGAVRTAGDGLQPACSAVESMRHFEPGHAIAA